eukprot:1361325-Amorphochlora_amoeboformis.AAC.1
MKASNLAYDSYEVTIKHMTCTRLIVNKAQIEAKNDQRWTAAMYAADAGHLHCLWYIWASIEEGHWEHLGS